MSNYDESGDTDLYDTVGPDIGISREDFAKAERLINVLEDLPTLEYDDIVDEYRRKYPSSNLFSDESPPTTQLEKQYRPAKLDLPGFGDERETCGAPIPHVCECCGEVVNIGRTCGQSTCPRCAPKWVLKTAPGIVNNIEGAARMMSANSGYDAVYKHHAVLCPPKEVFVDAEHPEQELISTIQDFMAEIDFQGIVVYHPWAGKSDEEDDEIALREDQEFKENHDDDRGEWKKRLFQERDFYGDVREELEHRPHFHLVGACPWFPGGDVVSRTYEKTDWIIHRITERNGSPVSLGEIDDVARAVVYALSHCAIDTRDDPTSKGGENNMYVYGKKGKEFLNADDRDLDEAKAECKSVAKRLLGIPWLETGCRTEVPDDEADHDHDPTDDADNLDDLEESSSSTSEEELNLKTCHGDLVSIDRADFVDDEDWRESAIFASEAIEKKEEWEADGGWRGWLEEQTGQSRLPTGEARSSDEPPPD